MRKGGGEEGERQVEEVLTRQLNKWEESRAENCASSEVWAAAGSPVRLSSYRHSISTHTQSALFVLGKLPFKVFVSLTVCLLLSLVFFERSAAHTYTHILTLVTAVMPCRSACRCTIASAASKETNEVQIIDMSMQRAALRALVSICRFVCECVCVCVSSDRCVSLPASVAIPITSYHSIDDFSFCLFVNPTAAVADCKSKETNSRLKAAVALL